MDRRTAMFLTMMLGGLIPRGLRAQSSGKKGSTKRIALQPVRSSGDEDDLTPRDSTETAKEVDVSPSSIPIQDGQIWKKYDIGDYVGLSQKSNNPQSALVEWIFRRTGTTPWHGDKLAILSASRTQLHVLNDAKIIKQVDEVVERFTQAVSNRLAIRVQYVAAVNPRWRYAVFSHLKAKGSGPQGQQIWTMSTEESHAVRAQMQVHQGYKMLAEQKVEMINGQTLKIETAETRGFTGGLQREAAAGMGYQPRADKLSEGVTLELSPLLTFDGDMIDAAVRLTANTVKYLHRVKVIAPREIGSSEMWVDVPEVVETSLNTTVKGWKLGETVLISAGIQPGILQSKNGFMNLRIPGTTPTETELLVFIDAEIVKEETASRPKPRRNDEEEDLDAEAISTKPKPRRSRAEAEPDADLENSESDETASRPRTRRNRQIE